MSEFDGTEQEPDFDDPSYAELRGMLSGARVDAPMPDSVLFKLEATLAGLVAEREEAEQDDEVVVPLRRRPLAPRLLGAAAAVVLIGGIGVGLNQVVSNTSGSNDKAASANRPAAAGAGSLSDPGTSGGRDQSGDIPGPLSGELLDQADSLKALAGPVAHFTRGKFDAQALQYVRTAKRVSLSYGQPLPTNLTSAPAPEAVAPDDAGAPVIPQSDDGLGSVSGGAATGTGGGAATNGGTQAGGGDDTAGKGYAIRKNGLLSAFRAYRTTPACPGPSPTDGSLVLRITFGKAPATLVLHPIVDGTQFVAAWSCDGTRLLAATTVKP